MSKATYDNANDFVADMMNNPAVIFADDYGRRWMYSGFEFYHQDLGDDSFKKGIFCLHLFGTLITKITTTDKPKEG